MDIGKISSTGLGSGLDVSSIVSQLMTLERKPLELMQESQTKAETQLSALGRLQSALGSMQDAARSLTSLTTWRATTVSSSDSSAVAATSSGNTPAGAYSVEVTKLASAQSVASATVPGPTHVIGTGMLHIQMGKWFGDPQDFTPTLGASQVSIAITASDNTLEKIRDKINNADAGVSASIVTDATGARLAIRSEATGESNGFKITVEDDDGSDDNASGLSMLAYDAAAASPMTRTQTAANAQLTINNIAISSESNTLSNVIDGLSLTLSRKTTAPVELSVNRDATSIQKSVTDFADAYNAVVKLVREQTAYNETTKKGGALQGDRSAVALLNQMRTLVGGSTSATTAFARLADVGLEPQRDGTLKVNSSKLTSAVGQLGELQKFFSRDDTGTASDGFATKLREFAQLQLGTDGSLTTRQAGLQERIEGMKDRVADFEDRLARTEKRLVSQYTKLDSNMAALSGLQSYITQQVAAWNK